MASVIYRSKDSNIQTKTVQQDIIDPSTQGRDTAVYGGDYYLVDAVARYGLR